MHKQHDTSTTSGGYGDVKPEDIKLQAGMMENSDKNIIAYNNDDKEKDRDDKWQLQDLRQRCTEGKGTTLLSQNSLGNIFADQ